MAVLDRLTIEAEATFVSSGYDPAIIAGQATVFKEIYSRIAHLDYLVVPLGSGGLAVGSLFATRHCGSSCRLVMAQPELAGDAKKSLETG